MPPMDPEARYQAYVAELERDYRLRIVPKPASGLHRSSHKERLGVSFGGMP